MESAERKECSEREKTRNTASKYDFVKVKVWLGEENSREKHYYVLSRYLICRMLTVTRIPHMKAVKIAMDLKKRLVDDNMLDVSQEQLESILFAAMEARGFGADYINSYKMVSEFFHQRRPLIILICGVPCSGKSTIAQALASRLNMPNVLQTDIIYELLQGTEEDGLLDATPLWRREDLDDKQLIAEFQREARIVRKGVGGDLTKTIRDGKPIIIEGMHIDPGLYLYEFGGYHALEHLRTKPDWKGEADIPSVPVQPPTQAVAPANSCVLQEMAGSERRPGIVANDAAGNGRRRYEHSASFALSYPQDPLHPHITSAELPSFPGRGPASLAVSTQSEVPEQGSPHIAGSPGLQWLQQMGVTEARRLDSRRFGKLPSASAWLGRKSRQLLGLSPKDKPTSTSPPRQSHDSAILEVQQQEQSESQESPGKQQAQHDSKPYATQSSFQPGPHQQCPVLNSSGQAIEAGTEAQAELPPADCSLQQLKMGGKDSPDGRAQSTRCPSPHVALASPETPTSPFDQHLISGGENGGDQQKQAFVQARGDIALGGNVSIAMAEPWESSEAAEQQHLSLQIPGSSKAETLPEPRRSLEQRRGSSEPVAMPDKNGPVFVPIIMSMAGRDHAMLVERWYSRQKVSNVDASDLATVQSRLHLLHQYLSSYSVCNVPVVTTNLMDMATIMDTLHAYLLECISLQMTDS